MQYKENETMASEPMVKLMADGTIECAKKLDLSECGYKPGTKVCGKCGAPAVNVKSDVDGDISVAIEETDVKSDSTEWVSEDGTKGMSEDEMVAALALAKKKPSVQKEAEEEMPEMAKPDAEDEEVASEAVVAETAPADEEPVVAAQVAPETEDDEKMMGMMGMSDEDFAAIVARRKKARDMRMNTMGVKSADFDDSAFVCAVERKVYPGSADVCAQCPGGCAAEGNMPSLVEVEGFAEDMFAGKVLDSGYADKTDIFVVDVERKDGKAVEAYFDGTTGECMGWHLLNDDLIGEIATIPGEKVISFSEAAEFATKSIAGDVVSVDADMFEGYDAYAVEIDGLDGKSYDVYVGIDGEVLGWDEYSADETAEMDAEVADLALKAMYSDDERMSMAKEGMALSDGSYPIKDEDDLKNAIMAYGRASNKARTKAHIMKRAAALGADDLIPESWSEKSDDEEEVLSDQEAKHFISGLMEFELLQVEQEIEGKGF
jgi:hypothetical protein